MREVSAVIFLLAFAIWRPELAGRPISWCGHALRRVARHRTLALVLVALTALALEVAIGLWVRWPLPGVHDEFAYLLQADTFVRGRLTNPPHSLSEFFETYHVLQRPTYQGKYPPAQGLVLALGQAMCSEPIVGVWLSVAAAAAAVCWMLQGWMPARWALLGGILAALHPSILAIWGQTFWGGAVAMLGSSLVFGATLRLVRRQRVTYAIVLGVGLGLLANSRPYEGLISSLPVACTALAWLLGSKRPALHAAIGKVGIPLLAVAFLVAGWMALYNFRVTGSPWRMPYQVWWESLTGNASMNNVLFGTPLGGPVSPDWHDRIFALEQGSMVVKLARQVHFYVTPALLPPLLVVPLLLRRRGMPLAIFTLLLVVAAVLLEGTAGHPHYTSPAAPLFFAVVVQGLRRWRLWRWRGRPSGQLFVAGLLVIYVLSSLHFLAVRWKDLPAYGLHNWCLARARIQARLESQPEKSLVIVRYRPNHSIHIDWVHNGADIDNAKVVWAHERDPQAVRRLVDYFPSRRAWLLEADVLPFRVVPYPLQPAHQTQQGESSWFQPATRALVRRQGRT